MSMIRVGLLVLTLASQAVSLSTEAESRAKAWLKQHENPDDAGMNDLKASDPNAWAMVQALLTKKSLGLLDPSHPSASFTGGAPEKHQSFTEAAEAAGITQDTPIAEVSELSVHSSMPYPTVGSSQPYPEVSQHSDPWNYKAAAQDDDSLVNSVVGQAAEASQDTGSSMSLSAVASQEQHSAYTPTAPAASRPSLSNTASSFSLPTLNWGNSYAGAADMTPVEAPKAQPEPELSLGSLRNSYLKQAAPVDVEQPAPAAPVVNSYLTNVDLGLSGSAATAGMDSSHKAEHTLEMSTFHSQMGSYRSSRSSSYSKYADAATPTSDSILALRKMNLGNNYNSYLKQARTNRWKRAMDVTMNEKPLVGGVANTYLLDLN